jgi:regulation of enolase protein 1 (concanavalin A-like superfamily)
MTRFLPLLLLPLASYAVSAPVPKEDDAARLRRVYGVTIDPDKDCTVELVGDKLRVKIPETAHWFGALRATSEPPRVLQEIEGDFTAIVRVTFPIRDSKRVEGQRIPVRAGGLLAWVDGKEYVQVLRADYDYQETFWQHNNAPGRTTITILKNPAERGYVRLKREGKKLIGAFSQDNKTWREFKEEEISWGEKIQVGVFAENASGAAFEVIFDEYMLTVPKK